MEFSDGKILFREMLSLCKTTVESSLAKISPKDLVAVIDACDPCAMTNWTLMRRITNIAQFFYRRKFPAMYKRHILFFNLADLEERNQSELVEFSQVIGFYEKFP
jgi:hypothetical protein